MKGKVSFKTSLFVFVCCCCFVFVFFWVFLGGGGFGGVVNFQASSLSNVDNNTAPTKFLKLRIYISKHIWMMPEQSQKNIAKYLDVQFRQKQTLQFILG